MNTLANCKASSRIRRVAGSCNGSQDFLDLLNDGVRMLMTRGNFFGTVKKCCACIRCNEIVWPRQVATPLAINRCNRTVPLQNHWAEFDALTRNDLLGYWGGGWEWNFGMGGCGQHPGLQGNTVPVFNPISGADGMAGVYIRFYPTQQADIGKTITVFGIDSNGEELRSVRSDGTVQDGIVTTLTLPFATMPASDRNVNTMRHITRIVKDVTDGPVYCFQYRASDNVMLDLARYESGEVLPDYQTTQLPGHHFEAAAGCTPMITALVKLQHIPAVNDDDLVAIENVDAIALAMQSIKLADSFDFQQKSAMEIAAVKELNAELRTRFPIDQTPQTFSAFGTALPSRAGIGRWT
jgi:hypothetical protein